MRLAQLGLGKACYWADSKPLHWHCKPITADLKEDSGCLAIKQAKMALSEGILS